jgi:hypothetical protein
MASYFSSIHKVVMKPLSRFNIIIACISILLVIVGSLLMGRSETGYYFLYPGFVVATIFSISTVFDVFRTKEISQGKKIIWMILTISVPVLGGLLFYILEYGNSKQVTQG